MIGLIIVIFQDGWDYCGLKGFLESKPCVGGVAFWKDQGRRESICDEGNYIEQNSIKIPKAVSRTVWLASRPSF